MTEYESNIFLAVHTCFLHTHITVTWQNLMLNIQRILLDFI